MYKIGEKIVYPMHGAGVISDIEEREILGELRQYYVLKIPHGDMKIMIPTDKCEEIGVRDVIDKDDIDDVLAILGAPSTPMPSNWNHRNRENMEKLKTGKISEVAEVVRNLTRVEFTKHLSTGEKKMLTNAKQILVSELVLAEHASQSEVEELVDNKINTSFMMFRSEDVVPENVVSKFIPFNEESTGKAENS